MKSSLWNLWHPAWLNTFIVFWVFHGQLKLLCIRTTSRYFLSYFSVLLPFGEQFLHKILPLVHIFKSIKHILFFYLFSIRALPFNDRGFILLNMRNLYCLFIRLKLDSRFDSFVILLRFQLNLFVDCQLAGGKYWLLNQIWLLNGDWLKFLTALMLFLFFILVGVEFSGYVRFYLYGVEKSAFVGLLGWRVVSICVGEHVVGFKMNLVRNADIVHSIGLEGRLSEISFKWRIWQPSSLSLELFYSFLSKFELLFLVVRF